MADNIFTSTKEYREYLDDMYVEKNCTNYRLSIIIPRYNTPYEFLSRCIYSVINSNHENIEIIVVDDGSEESVERLLYEEFDIYINKIRYYYKKNEGLGLSRNFGIKKAEGDFVFFLDSDDTIEAKGLKRMLAHAIFYDLDMVAGKRVNCDENGAPLREAHRDLCGDTYSIMYNDKESDVFKDQLVTNKLIRRTTILDNNIWFKEGVYEDIEYSALLYVLIQEYHYINVHIYNWYKYGDNTTLSSATSIANLAERVIKLQAAWELTPSFNRRKRIKFIIQSEFITYLYTYYDYCDEKSRNDIWDLIYGFIESKKDYIFIDDFKGRSKKLADSLFCGDYEKFCKIVKELYYIDRCDKSFNNYIVETKEQAYYAYLHAIRSNMPARLFIENDKKLISKNYIKHQKRGHIYTTVKTFKSGKVIDRLNKELEKCEEDEYIFTPTFLYGKYDDIFKSCNKRLDNIYIFSKEKPYWYYINRTFSNIKIVKLSLLDKIRILLLRYKLRLQREK